MKVLLLSNMYPPKICDSYFGNFVKNQVLDLEKSGIKIIKAVRTQRNKLSYFPFFLRSIYCLLFKGYNLIHAHYGFHSALPALIFKCAPLIVTYHRGDALEEPYRNFIYWWLQLITIKKAAHIIAVSQEIKEVLISQLGASKNKISVIPCGVDTQLFKPLHDKQKLRKEIRLPEDKPIVSFVGPLSHRKGIDIIYKCATFLQDVTFVLIGDYKSQKTEMPPNCIKVGPKPPSEIPKWLAASDIFLLPSRSEGTPVSLLEALSCGIPAVTSNVGGLPQVMQNGKTGWMVPPEDADAIIDKITKILGSKEEKNLMAKHAREVIIKKFDKNIITEKIKKLYQNA